MIRISVLAVRSVRLAGEVVSLSVVMLAHTHVCTERFRQKLPGVSSGVEVHENLCGLRYTFIYTFLLQSNASLLTLS